MRNFGLISIFLLDTFFISLAYLALLNLLGALKIRKEILPCNKNVESPCRCDKS